jgi:hypothetical protein
MTGFACKWSQNTPPPGNNRIPADGWNDGDEPQDCIELSFSVVSGLSRKRLRHGEDDESRGTERGHNDEVLRPQQPEKCKDHKGSKCDCQLAY